MERKHVALRGRIALCAVLVLAGGVARAAQFVAEMRAVSGPNAGSSVGRVLIHGGPDGAVFVPDLEGLPPGSRGFHVHENGDCGRAGAAAGGHWEGAILKSASGMNASMNSMPMGDLPDLQVAADGRSIAPVTATHIRQVAKLAGKALMIHNADGERLACGIVKPWK